MPGGSPGGGGKPDGAPGPRGRTRRLSPCRALRSAATLLLLLAAGSATEAGAQSVRPHGPWRSVESPHFHLAFRAELEQLVPHALQAAEFAWDSLARALPPPEGRIDLVLDDAHDQANGFGGPFPGNHVILWAAPPVDEPTLAFYDDWWRVLLCHELTHVFALDRTGRLGRIGRAVLGRVPSSWPLFPVVRSPGWAIEGVPVLHESRFTGYGRLHGSWHEMAVRTAILEGRFDPIDRASNAAASWPAGRRPYIYGSLFLGRLAREGGPDAGARLTEAAAAATLPAPVFFDRLGRSALGRNFTEEWRAWQEDLERRYGAWSDSLRALGVTTGERLAGGYFTAHPRVSPDGKTVVFYGSDGRTPAGLHRFDPETGNTRRLCDWHSESPVAWLADGGLLAGRLEAVDAYEERTELVRLDAKGGLRDRFSGERLREPDEIGRAHV